MIASGDTLLLSVDPVRGLLAVSDALQRVCEMDDRVREAAALVADRMDVISATERDDIFAPLVWLALRGRFGARTVATICRSLSDRTRVLRAVDTALATTLDIDVLRTRCGGGRSDERQPIVAAREELARARTGGDSPILTLAIDLAIAAALAGGTTYAVEQALT